VVEWWSGGVVEWWSVGGLEGWSVGAIEGLWDSAQVMDQRSFRD
jgi:hypothetical protein